MDYVQALYYKLMSSGSERALKRFNHSLGVAFKALEIIEDNKLPVDKEKAYIAGLLHDYSKFTKMEDYEKIVKKYNMDKSILEENEKVLHGILGYKVVEEELGIKDKEILKAIENHVMGTTDMSILEEVIYLADYVENNRVGEEYEVAREIAKTNYKKAIAYECESILKYLIAKGSKVNENTYLMYSQYRKYLND